MASVLTRITMAARTTSRGSGAPTPTAWLRTRFSCSSRTFSTRDVRRGELAEAGRHAVDDAFLGDDLLDDAARAGDAVERGCAELDRPARARHRDHVGDAQRRVADDERSRVAAGRRAP